MKKTAAAASALALGALTTPAYADEAPANHDWKGFYAGATVGHTSADHDWKIDGGEGFSATEDGSKHPSESRAQGALLMGYNHQDGALVVGGELDYSLLNFEENTRFDGGEGADLRSKMHGFGTVRGRVGYAAGNLLYFATAGLAIGDLKHTYNSDGSPATKHVSATLGWVAGGGVELAVSENVSLTGEAVYAEIGRAHV